MTTCTPGTFDATCKQLTADSPFGEPFPLGDDLYLVRVPLPHNPLRSLNSYFITAEDKTTIIDVGFNHPACEEALNRALDKLGRAWDSVEIVLTHSHPDHTGNLDRIWREGMPVYAHLHSFQEVENLQDMESTVFEPLLLQAATPDQAKELSFERESRIFTSLPSCCRSRTTPL